ncbi:agmatine deiminase family protein [Campylobacter peloridis]|uniref:agmatine deiminase family protein n=1 Tax=Campylobacter peloridis TaxID=488546 RepID=UPI001C73655E|nr:agmatine deiminase family protein [Campylobacter peloridis]MBX1885534.1 agmatine deiminase family protein [Campylobacter peloridis]
MIALSKLLKSQHKKIYQNLVSNFAEFNIAFKEIPSNDIWLRDFMPLVYENTATSYIYDPDYLKKYPHLKTTIKPLKNHLNLVLDGGNFIRMQDKAFMCEKIFSQNPTLSKENIIQTLKQTLNLNHIIFLPRLAYDRFAHSDSMVRFISKDHVLINDFSLENKQFFEKLNAALKDFKITKMSYSKEFMQKYKWGGYLNFLEFDKAIFVPTYGIEEDERVLSFLQNIYKDKKIIDIYLKPIIKKGGALHCISANILQ